MKLTLFLIILFIHTVCSADRSLPKEYDVDILPECGTSCIYLVLRLCGEDISIQEAIELVHPNYRERPLKSSLSMIENALSSLGYYTSSLSINIADLKKIEPPAILLLYPQGPDIDVGHFVTYCGLDEAEMFIFLDPYAFPIERVIDENTLDDIWNGTIVILSNNPIKINYRLFKLRMFGNLFLFTFLVGIFFVFLKLIYRSYKRQC
jgi:ABC-type bacteriocin/lantibiotic exporter with double-glycine peptidase domain